MNTKSFYHVVSILFQPPSGHWTPQIQSKEWINLFSHLRRVEWDSIFKQTEDDSDLNTQLPPKLKIPKYNRPNLELLEDYIKLYIYRKLMTGKLLSPSTCINRTYRSS